VQDGAQSSSQCVRVRLPLALGSEEYLAGAEHVGLQEPIKVVECLAYIDCRSL
jgi:hypothetical protein